MLGILPSKKKKTLQPYCCKAGSSQPVWQALQMKGVGNLCAQNPISLPFLTPATQASLKVGGNTCNIATQLNLQHFCKTSCTLFVGVQKTTTQKTKTYDLENDDLENDDLETNDLENDDLENDDLENDDRDGVARRIKGLEGYRRREIRGRQGGIMKG